MKRQTRIIVALLAAVTAAGALTAPRSVATPAALPAGVVFQDTGTVEGWSNYPQKPQKKA